MFVKERTPKRLLFKLFNIYSIVFLKTHKCPILPFFFVLKILFILFLERGEGREKQRERNIYVWLPPACPQPFGSRVSTQSTEPTS